MTVLVVDRRSVWQRVLSALTPWSHLTQRADEADVEVERLRALADHRHDQAQRGIRDAYREIGKRLDA